MWIEAGFAPETFYEQTPRHFQLAMEAVRKRLERDMEAQLTMAWNNAAFTGAAQAGKLKPLRNYLRKAPAAQKPAEMLAAMLAHQSNGVKMTVRKINLEG